MNLDRGAPRRASAVVQLRREELEPCLGEIGVEGKGSRYQAPPHHEEADVIDETDVTLRRPSQLADTRSVQILIHPFDHKRGRILPELVCRREAETGLEQGDRLDEHVIVSEQIFATRQNRLQMPDRCAVVGIGGVGPSVDR